MILKYTHVPPCGRVSLVFIHYTSCSPDAAWGLIVQNPAAHRGRNSPLTLDEIIHVIPFQQPSIVLVKMRTPSRLRYRLVNQTTLRLFSTARNGPPFQVMLFAQPKITDDSRWL